MSLSPILGHPRYVGIIWFIFMLSNFHWLDLWRETCVTLANLQWNICKNRMENQILPWFSYGHQKCMFLDFLTRYIGSRNYIHFWVYWV